MKLFRFLFLTILVSFASFSLHAEADGSQALVMVKKLVGYVKFSEKKPEFADKALENVGSADISKYLLGSYAAKATPAQDTRFQGLIRDYLKVRAFPESLRYIKDVDLSYSDPVVKGDTVSITSSLLYAGSEKLIFTWVVTKKGDQYYLTDFLDAAGTSAMLNSRDKQIIPLIKKRGIDGMLDTMQNVIKSYR